MPTVNGQLFIEIGVKTVSVRKVYERFNLNEQFLRSVLLGATKNIRNLGTGRD